VSNASCPDNGSCPPAGTPPAPDPNGRPRPGQGAYTPAAYGFPLLAAYGQRVASYLIDVGIPAGVLVIVLMAALGSDGVGVQSAAYVLAALLALAFVVWNSGYRQGRTGQSIGKRALGVRLVTLATGQPVGFGPSLGRQLAHVLDGLPLFLGFLWPLWDEHRQTFADKMWSTLVVQTDP
jgi:uncharacterized RDD family membrane protein YckC